jgi:hypothetical protein
MPSTSGNEYRTSRTRFFTKLKEDGSSAALSMSTVRSHTSTGQTGQSGSQRTIDLEGIKPDGFGYTVTITTGRGTKVRRRWDIRNKVWHYYPEQEVSDVEEEEEEQELDVGPSGRKRSIFSQGSFGRKKSESAPGTGESEKRAMEVQMEKTVDVRESFHSQKFERGFDYRNPYKGPPNKYEEEIEVGVQVSEAAVSDWSMFDNDAHRLATPGTQPSAETGNFRRPTPGAPIPSSPAVPTSSKLKRRGSSYDSQRYTVSQRHSSDSVRPRTGSSRLASSHKGSQSYDNIRMGVLPSPSTANFDHRCRASSPPMQSVLHPPSPPPLPPAARVRRSTSPAITPINSSHRWVTSTFLSHRREDDPSTSRTTSPDSDPDPYQPRQQPTHRLSGSGDQWGKMSIQSSLRAENGSGRSMAFAMQRQRSCLPRGQDGEESSDEDFALPLQRPSPRNSVAFDLGPPPRVRSRSIPRSMPSIPVRLHR